RVSSGDLSGPALGVVVHSNSIQTVIILLRTSAGDGHFGSEASQPAIDGACITHLSRHGVDAGLKRRKIGPASSGERQLDNCGGAQPPANRGRSEFHGGRFRSDLDRLSNLSNRQSEIQNLLGSDGQSDPGSYRCRETGRGGFHFIASWEQIGYRV